MSTMTVSYASGDARRPFIRIGNRHLLTSGFFIGSKFSVEYANNLITLKKLTHDNNNLQTSAHIVAISTGETSAEEGV